LLQRGHGDSDICPVVDRKKCWEAIAELREGFEYNEVVRAVTAAFINLMVCWKFFS
jgi:hypothetical protein